MAKYSNVLQEAAKRYRDLKSRGFIPASQRGLAYRDVINEVAAENKGKDYNGAFTAKAYAKAYGRDVDYFEDTTFEDLQKKRDEDLVKMYRDKLEEIYNGTNDFYDMAEAYGQQKGFDVDKVGSLETLDELISHARTAQQVQPYLFRNKKGRNRREESGLMDTYQSTFIAEITTLIQQMNQDRLKFAY